MRFFSSLLILIVYLLGTVLSMSATPNGTTQTIQVTHSHPIESPDDHDHHHPHGHAGSNVSPIDQDQYSKANAQVSPESKKQDDQPVPHSHCVSIAASGSYCLRLQAVSILPATIKNVEPISSESRIPEEPSLGSIFRPPIA